MKSFKYIEKYTEHYNIHIYSLSACLFLFYFYMIFKEYVFFYYVEVHSYHTQFIENFYSILSNAFSASIDNHMIFIFHSANMKYHIYWLAYVEPSVHSRNKSPLVIVCDSFNVLWNLACYCFVENFYICLHQGYWPVIFFFWGILIWLWYYWGNADWAPSLAHSRVSELFCA